MSSPRAARRWIVRVILAMACGAVLTPLIAWAAALRRPSNSYPGERIVSFDPTPVTFGGTTYVGQIWAFNDTYRIGERRVWMISAPTPHVPKSIETRPPLPAE